MVNMDIILVFNLIEKYLMGRKLQIYFKYIISFSNQFAQLYSRGVSYNLYNIALLKLRLKYRSFDDFTDKVNTDVKNTCQKLCQFKKIFHEKGND